MKSESEWSHNAETSDSAPMKDVHGIDDQGAVSSAFFPDTAVNCWTGTSACCWTIGRQEESFPDAQSP